MLTITPVQLRLKNILVPVDFSPIRAPAVKLARELARQHGSTVHLANVIELFDVSGMSTATHRKTDVEGALADFGSIEEEYLLGINHERLVLDGDVNEALLRAIRERDIDLVVMATHGAVGCERILEGSINEELFRQAPSPILTVGPRVKSDFGRFASLRKILYPVEMTPSSLAAVAYLVRLANTCATRITPIHVAHPDIQSPSERQRIRERLDSEIRALFPEQVQDSISDVIVEFGSAAETIIEFAIARAVDAIVLGVRRGGAFIRSATHVPWSVTHAIIADAPCPVLTIRG